jgi:hypothetical protein
VTVYNTANDEPGDHDKRVGHPATTDAEGAYEFEDHGGLHDNYYAEVAKRKFGRRGHRKTCLAARSPFQSP